MPLLGHPFRLFLATGQTLAFAHVFWQYVYSVAPGSGPSMLPTFLVWNEWFVADRSYRRGRHVRVGDCVTYTIPVEPHEDGVKRVIGMPGDYVLVNSPGAKNDDMMQVPQGHCYIVGDNLPWSRDSRDYGPLPLALIRGKVVAKVEFSGWNPLNWFTRVKDGLTPAESST
ncbi:peptidase S24/S26A/S26B/S26C [Truncatella angustata]|uniref:Mitochondrial inner membrane protease subunit n=1 Tax=Truncatella angustata TaxID=152316 RepID=A0A9P8UFE2_9PEZI|nr:peptidase S24/S26A/S26B/S26C [Truncatella angustata]KAH6648988.1 peptidase S24/S26A/S26B/S26C [Truncatella angustata]KAH8200759.1 hypothetical protein TruAng_005076 [Truncatella angustata]